MPIYKKHINQLFQVIISHLKNLFSRPVWLPGRLFVVLFFYRRSHSTNSATCKALVPSFRKSTHVNTTKNCVHVLCKNDWEYFALFGRAY